SASFHSSGAPSMPRTLIGGVIEVGTASLVWAPALSRSNGRFSLHAAVAISATTLAAARSGRARRVGDVRMRFTGGGMFRRLGPRLVREIVSRIPCPMRDDLLAKCTAITGCCQRFYQDSQ